SHPDLDGSDFVFGAVRSPVRELGGDDVGAAYRVMERGVDNPGLHAFGNLGLKCDLARARSDRDEVAVANPSMLGIKGVNLEDVFVMPGVVVGPPGLRSHVVLGENPAGGQD